MVNVYVKFEWYKVSGFKVFSLLVKIVSKLCIIIVCVYYSL